MEALTLVRLERVMPPEMVLKPKPCSPSLTFNQSMVLLNWLKTRALAVGSAALMSSSCTAGKASGRQSDEQCEHLPSGVAVMQALNEQDDVLTGPATDALKQQQNASW